MCVYLGTFSDNGVSSGSNNNKIGQFVNIEMELRKCCNHPFLIRGVEDAECTTGTQNEYYTKV